MTNNLEIIKDLAGNQFKILYRINHRNQRIYIQEPPFMYYSGLTGALSASTLAGDPAKKRLQGWRESFINNFGKESVNNYVDMTAEFGTLLHTALVTIKEKGKIVWSEERDKATATFEQAYIEQHKVPDLYVIDKMVYEYQKHVASVLQFVYERVDSIWGIEAPAIWKEYKIATPIDLICVCRQTPKGQFEPTCINLKTSSQITQSHMEQVACEVVMWNDTYPDHTCVNSAILRSKNWTEGKTPTYDYKYQTYRDSLNIAGKKARLLELCLDSDASYYPKPDYKHFTGETEIGGKPEIVVRTLEQEFLDTKGKK